MEVPKTPVVPNSPEVEVPKTPAVPNSPEVETPKTPVVPNSPEVETPKTPPVPSLPEVENPKESVTPSVPRKRPDFLPLKPEKSPNNSRGRLEKPQAFFLRQPHTGELSSYCGYYALCNYFGKELNIEAVRFLVKEKYASIGISGDEVDGFIREYGATIDGIATGRFNFKESNNLNDVENARRFMVNTTKHGGHWISYIKDRNDLWWEYDGWEANPKFIGDSLKLFFRLKELGSFKVFFEGSF